MDRISTLFSRYKNNLCTPEEVEELLEYFKMDENELLLKESIGFYLQEHVDHEEVLEAATDDVYANLKIHLVTEKEEKGQRFVYKWAVAASVVLGIGIGGYFYAKKPDKQLVAAHKTNKNIILPGSNKAVLTLGNGRQIVLSGAADGVVAHQGSTKIVKNANGQITYNAQSTGGDSNLADAYNTITTPRGGQYQVILHDGSRVLLNAASSLTYPTTFTGKSRNVELKGEAYFEVAKNKEMPFVVKANGTNVQVLGTHFNISAYDDDPSVVTTLLEGSVLMSKGSSSALLTPGQQGSLLNTKTDITVKNADVEQVMAWTTGSFVFNDLNIKEIMKMVGRWYDVDVVYQGNVQFKKFGGATSRYKDITELLDYMKITGNINYKIEERRVTLMN